jgi:hypothetical protein
VGIRAKLHVVLRGFVGKTVKEHEGVFLELGFDSHFPIITIVFVLLH